MHLYDDIAEELSPEGGPASRFPWMLFFLVSFLSHLTLLLLLQQWGKWERPAVAPSETEVQLIRPETLAPPVPKPRELLFGTDQEKDLKAIPKGKETRLPPIPKSERPGLPAPKVAPSRPAAPTPLRPPAPPSLPRELNRSDAIPSVPPSTPAPLEPGEARRPAPLPSLPADPGVQTAPIRPNGLPGLPFADAKSLDQLAKVFTDQEKVPPKDTISLNTDDLKYFSYALKLKSKIEYVWRYPAQASERGIQGDLLLNFTILKDGQVTDVRVVSTSGYDLLDEEAVRAIKAAAPFAPLPDSWHQDQLTITGHFLYSNRYTYLR